MQSNNNEEFGAISKLVLKNDLSGLTEQERLDYYLALCKQLGLSPITKPFELLKLRDKLILYTTASCYQQLAARHSVSTQIVKTDRQDGLFIVTARATLPSGQFAENIGVCVTPNDPIDLANSYMKTVTKAFRRAVKSLIGLGLIDESELDTVPDAQTVSIQIPEQPASQTAAKQSITRREPQKALPASDTSKQYTPAQRQQQMLLMKQKIQKLDPNVRKADLDQLDYDGLVELGKSLTGKQQGERSKIIDKILSLCNEVAANEYDLIEDRRSDRIRVMLNATALEILDDPSILDAFQTPDLEEVSKL